jgi:hypothetical protein
MRETDITDEDIINEVLAFLHERLIFDYLRVPVAPHAGATTLIAPTETNEKYWYWCVHKALAMFDTLRYGTGILIDATHTGTVIIRIEPGRIKGRTKW